MNTLPRRYAGLAGFDVLSDNVETPPSLLDNFELIQDLARYAEGLFTREQVKRRWKKLITNEMWETLGSNDELVDRIEAEKVRRIRDGSFKRERAQQHITKGPDILNDIMSDPKQSAKYRIDSAKALDQFAANSPDAAEEKDRIIIKIDLSADTKDPKDVLVFETSGRPTPLDTDGKIIDHTPHPQQLTQQEPTPPVKRGPGRPPGSKNKPKGNDGDE
jgi:hypothetical protein